MVIDNFLNNGIAKVTIDKITGHIPVLLEMEKSLLSRVMVFR